MVYEHKSIHHIRGKIFDPREDESAGYYPFTLILYRQEPDSGIVNKYTGGLTLVRFALEE